jgi:hypothetical protein
LQVDPGRGDVNGAPNNLATKPAPVELNPLDPNTRFYVSPEGDVLDAKTYARNSSFRKGVRDEAWGDAVDSETGLVRDPLSDAVMNKEEAWDMGIGQAWNIGKNEIMQ